MGSDLEKFLDQVLQFDDPEKLKTQTANVLGRYQFTKFTYIGFNPPKSDKGPFIQANFVQTTYPKEWLDTYVKNSFLYVDPLVQKAKSSLLPFLWDSSEEAETATAQQRKFFKKAEKFGILRGAVIPIHAPNGEFAIMALVFDGSKSDLQKVWDVHKNDIHLLGIYYHATVWENILKPKPRPNPGLSPRELQCLQWAARGKTLWETAQIMGISEETAKTHLKSVMRKLETSNKTHAVSKAQRYGLITV